MQHEQSVLWKVHRLTFTISAVIVTHRENHLDRCLTNESRSSSHHRLLHCLHAPLGKRFSCQRALHKQKPTILKSKSFIELWLIIWFLCIYIKSCCTAFPFHHCVVLVEHWNAISIQSQHSQSENLNKKALHFLLVSVTKMLIFFPLMLPLLKTYSSRF